MRFVEQAFDRRWWRWLERELDLRAVNAEVERQCALRPMPPRALAFRPRTPVTVPELLERCPPAS